MGADLSFIDEIENVIAHGSTDRRSQILERVTDLFVLGSARLSEDDISIFDDVIGRLAAKIEQSAQVLLANRLAPIANSPPKTIRTLALHDAIEVAGPVLTQSVRLDDQTLLEVATQKGQGHMLAIAHRASLSEAVTDVLVERGDRDVVLGTVENRGARFSRLGFARLLQRSESDDGIAASVGARPDLPPHLLLTLVAHASETARSRLEAANPQAKKAVREAVIEATQRVQAEVLEEAPGYAVGLATVENLQQSGRLNEPALAEFAKCGSFVETSAALAVMAALPLSFIEQAMVSDRSETILVLGRAIGLSWPTVKEILLLRAKKRIISETDIARALASFERLRPQTAQEIVGYYRTRARGKASRPA
jgi:uncharacterized protein (DUF2336 family)